MQFPRLCRVEVSGFWLGSNSSETPTDRIKAFWFAEHAQKPRAHKARQSLEFICQCPIGQPLKALNPEL